MARWILVRHAQSHANVAGWYSGHVDVGLTPVGRAQARALAPVLGEHPVDAVLSSDLCRAHDTARLALAAAGREGPVACSPALRERDVGDWSGRRHAELVPLGLHDVLGGWHTAPPRGESLRDVALRALPWLAEQRDAPTLLVAHGGVLRMLLGLLDDLPFDRFDARRVANAAPHVREVPPGRWAALLARVEASPSAPPPAVPEIA